MRSPRRRSCGRPSGAAAGRDRIRSPSYAPARTARLRHRTPVTSLSSAGLHVYRDLTLAQRPRWDPMSMRTTLADGRELLFFSLPGHTPAPVADRRPLPPWEPGQSQLRFDQTTGQWVIIAARRQDRTYKPPPDQCPLCPGPTGLTSEVPAPDYDVVVFENRFPSLSGAGSAASVPDGFVPVPGVGRCEVICFSSNHTGSFAELSQPHARLVVDAWRHRTADLLGDAGRASRCSASRTGARRSASRWPIRTARSTATLF